MQFKLIPLTDEKTPIFKRDMQEAFQKGAQAAFGKIDEEILPEKDIDSSLSAEGSAAYIAVCNGDMVGGAIVVIDNVSQHNHLDFLYVKYGCQSKGIGKNIWQAIEKLYPDTKVWETFTPYFEKRNLHFYINQCGFHAVEYYNKFHKDPDMHDSSENTQDIEYFDDFFRFEKQMK